MARTTRCPGALRAQEAPRPSTRERVKICLRFLLPSATRTTSLLSGPPPRGLYPFLKNGARAQDDGCVRLGGKLAFFRRTSSLAGT